MSDFSQIPSVVFTKVQRPLLKRSADWAIRPPTPPPPPSPIPEPEQSQQEEDVDGDIDVEETHKELIDAVVQANIRPETNDASTQTDLAFQINQEDYEESVKAIKRASLCSSPPLKVGLTLPKGKKRKVFYPGEAC